MTPDKVEETKKFYSTNGIPEEMKQALAFMRQWLNEDRKATPMVTARDLWHWLEKDYNKALTQHHQDMMSERDKQWREHLKVILGTDIYGMYEKYFTPEYWETAQTIIKSK